MEPLPPTPINRAVTGIAGFAAGIVAQILFRIVIDAVIGPVSGLFSGEMLAWIIILLIPPIASYMFLEVVPGSLKEHFIHSFQLGSLFWFVLILISLFA
jgi:hypothetical protein